MIKKILLALLILLVIAQFFSPEKNQGALASIEPFLEETNPPENVKMILKESCYDCHSDFTRYPWYNNITPVNYWLAEHVNDGKKHFNFSNWVGNSVKRKDHKMEEFIEMVKKKETLCLGFFILVNYPHFCAPLCQLLTSLRILYLQNEFRSQCCME